MMPSRIEDTEGRLRDNHRRTRCSSNSLTTYTLLPLPASWLVSASSIYRAWQVTAALHTSANGEAEVTVELGKTAF